jgi:4-hydroxy 2-oxovalerate aldolase
MSFSETLDVRITDSSLRDGSHPKRHAFSTAEVARVVTALDAAGVPVIEVSHGDGLSGSSFAYGRSSVDERELIATAVAHARSAKIAALMLPGVAVKDDISRACDLGVRIIRIATHCTEADVSIQHFGLARKLGLETVGFLMMSHSTRPEALAIQARIMADAGCECVYVVDSAGAMILEEAADRVSALVAELGTDAQVGFHAHQNLSLAVANSLHAIRAGAVQIDGSTRGFGAGAGNAPVEALVAVCARLGYRTGIDPMKIMDAAEEVVRPIMPEECVVDRLSLTMGYAGVYSSFLKHAFAQAERFEVSPVDILTRAGDRRLVGGQEDQLIDIARELQREASQP